MKIRNHILAVIIAALVLPTFPLAASTTTFNGGAAGTDSWNNGSNWNAGVPAGVVDAVVASGKTAAVLNAATPAYFGSLTLESNALLDIGNLGGSPNAAMASGITLKAGAILRWNINANLSFPPMTLAGNASWVTPFGASDHQTDNFAAVSGAHTLTINGFNNHTFNLNASNTFSHLICNASDRYNIRAKAPGALGTGDVVVNQRGDQVTPNRSARLYFDVPDVMADTATLYLNGPVNGGGYTGDGVDWVVINHTGNEKIAALYIYGVKQAPGTYTSAEKWLGGTGTLTVEPIIPNNPAPAFGTVVPGGNVELTWTNLSPNTGSDIWVDVWFGTDPAALGQVAAGQLNLESFTVSAPEADDYYWRVDSYLDGAPTGTPLTGTVFRFKVVDTDGDGFLDGVETNTGIWVSASDTGTDPTNPDTDGDGTGDWFEISASFTDPFIAASKPRIQYPLPAPNGLPGASNKPVKVYIMSGQSNMLGFGTVSGTGDGTLESMTRRQNKFPNLIDSAGNFIPRQDVRYRGLISGIASGPLAPGFGGDSRYIGPELGFGQIMGWYHDAPVLLLKSSIGNRSLGWDILPPGSVSYVYGSTNYGGYGDWGNSPVGGTPPTSGSWYAGKEFDRFFMDESEWAHPDTADINIVDILDNWTAEYAGPGKPFEGQDFEIAGFVWWQGDKDRYDMGYASRYEPNLVKLITSLRSYYTNRYPGKVATNAPFVLATLGQTTLDSTNETERAILDAKLAVDGESGKYPQFAGNVKTVYSHPLSQGGSSAGHYNGNAQTYMLVGDALGRAMVELLVAGTTPGGDYDTWAAGYPAADLGDPNADNDGDGLSNNDERVWGLDPTRGDSVNPIALPLDAAAGTLTYTRRNPALSGASFSYQWSPTLVDGSWTPFTPASEIGDGGSPVESVTITLDAALLDEPKLFVRVVASFN